jgi:hypothetical protein
MTNTSTGNADGHSWDDTWHAARHMHASLANGESLPPIPAPVMVRLGPGETAYADLTVTTHHHRDRDPQPTGFGVVEQRTLLLGPASLVLAGIGYDLWTQRRARRRAHADATARRDLAATRVILTCHRMLLHTGAYWTDLAYDDIAAAEADLAAGYLTLHPYNSDPLQLYGPWVPLLAVILAHLAWPPGHPGQYDLDWLAPLTTPH